MSATSTVLSPDSHPVTSRWPPGIAAAVLTAETGLYAVDDQGVVWARKTTAADQPSTTVTLRGPQVVSGLDGLAVSSNHEFLAYVEEGTEIVVRSIADGRIVHRAAVQSDGHATLRSISPDGILAALVTVDPQLEAEDPADEVPWSVTVVDLTTGIATVEDKLSGFVRRRIEAGGRCGLTTLSWLPEYKLIVGVSGDPYESYLYDPIADRLEVIPGLDYIWDSTPGDLVLGTSMGQPAEAVVWNVRDGSSELVVLDSVWSTAGPGGINADGTALVLMVAKSPDWKSEHGWQVFRQEGSEWRPAGPVAEVDWMNQPPTLLSRDGRRAWTVVPQSTADNRTVLLSHDFTTGAWEEWFRTEDMQADWGSFGFAALVVDSAPDEVSPSTTVPLPTNYGPAHDFFWGLSGDGYDPLKMESVQEGETTYTLVVIRVAPAKECRAFYDLVYDRATTLAKKHGIATDNGEGLRVVLVEATSEQKVLESRDFILVSVDGGE